MRSRFDMTEPMEVEEPAAGAAVPADIASPSNLTMASPQALIVAAPAAQQPEAATTAPTAQQFVPPQELHGVSVRGDGSSAGRAKRLSIAAAASEANKKKNAANKRARIHKQEAAEAKRRTKSLQRKFALLANQLAAAQKGSEKAGALRHELKCVRTELAYVTAERDKAQDAMFQGTLIAVAEQEKRQRVEAERDAAECKAKEQATLAVQIKRAAEKRKKEQQRECAEQQQREKALSAELEAEIANAAAAEKECDARAAEVAKLKTQLASLQRMRGAEGQAEIKNATKKLEAAELKLSSLRSQVKSSALDANNARKACMALEKKAAAPTQLEFDRSGDEDYELLQERVAELEAELKAERARSAEYKSIAEPPASFFLHKGYTARMAVTGLALMQLGLSTAKVSEAMSVVAKWLRVKLPTKKVTVPATEKEERHTIEREILPCETYWKGVTDQAPEWADLHIVQALVEHQASAAKAGKDPCLGSNLNCTSDSATAGKNEYISINAIANEKKMCLSLAPITQATTVAKAQAYCDMFDRIGKAMNAQITSELFDKQTRLMAVEVSSVAQVASVTTDKGASDKGVAKASNLAEAKRTSWAKVMGFRFLCVSRRVVGVQTLASCDGKQAQIVMRLAPNIGDAEAQAAREYMAKHELREVIEDVTNHLLEMQPPAHHVPQAIAARLHMLAAGTPLERASASAARPDASGIAKSKFTKELDAYRQSVMLTDIVEFAANVALLERSAKPLERMADALIDGEHAKDVLRRRDARTDAHAQRAARDEDVLAMGTFLLGDMTDTQVKAVMHTEWTYCHEHGLVNTIKAAEEAVMKDYLLKRVTPEQLAALASKLSGGKAKTPDSQKWKTNVWLYGSPLWHYIYRLCIYIAPHSEKEWTKGNTYLSWLLANEKISYSKYLKLARMPSVHGNRNAIFWVCRNCRCVAPRFRADTVAASSRLARPLLLRSGRASSMS